MVYARPERVPSLESELTHPLFIRGKDYQERQKLVDRARKRRRTRVNSLTLLFFGASLIGGGVAALLLGMILTEVRTWALVPAGVACVFGYRMTQLGAEDYVMSFNETYADAVE